MIAYIDAHRARFGVEPIYRALQFAPRTDYAAKQWPASKRAVRDAELRREIVVVGCIATTSVSTAQPQLE